VKTLVFTFMVILLSSITYAEIYTGALSPSSIDVCGTYSDSFELVATNIWNMDNFTHYGVEIRLVNPDTDAFTIISDESVILGDIPVNSESPIDHATWQISCDDNYPGNYTFYVEYHNSSDFVSDSQGETESVVAVHEEYHPPIEMVLIEPDLDIYTDAPDLIVDTNVDATCRYDENETSYSSMVNTMVGAGTEHSADLGELEDGEYTYYIACKNPYDETSGMEVIFTIDNSPPEITSYSPSSRISTSYTQLAVNTNKDAICKYGNTEGMEYSNMNEMSSLDKREHTLNLVNLYDGLYKYYIRCEDMAGNIMSDDFICYNNC